MNKVRPSIELNQFKTRPIEPRHLLTSLQAIFPSFGREDRDVTGELKEAQTAEHGLHYVMRRFAEFFSTSGEEISDRQLRALGYLLNASVTVDDVLENAVSTCLLEHLRQMNRYKLIAPYLSKTAKRKAHA